MILEFIDVTGGGAFPDASPESLIRISNFSEKEKKLLVDAVRNEVLAGTGSLALHDLDFVQAPNCAVTLRLSQKDEGLMPALQENYYTCLLTRESFHHFIDIIRKVEDGYNWLTPGEYSDEPAFLISKHGPW